eukprot:TRINITY_DN1619_c0_g1_i1.p1 TRINITY_DN1619_c0_g1~~TRINITY_DN1619_c0_g1_i1.p1  ORF type:complete len:327 (+),score=82.28 TRINITY_DN1619_c0_g1_i1:158-1138(+)
MDTGSFSAMSDASTTQVDERVSSMQRGVPQFLLKLYKMTNNTSHDHIIKWSDDDNSFWVADIAAFSRDVLPAYFKHNNYASFVRQLNMYGFHRSTNNKGKVSPGVGMIERFSNPHFRRGREDLLVFIHRKSSSSKKSRASNSNASASATPQPTMDTSQQQVTDQRLVALERQVQFLHLQNQALAAQSSRQQETLQHIMRVFSRMGISAGEANTPFGGLFGSQASMGGMGAMMGGGNDFNPMMSSMQQQQSMQQHQQSMQQGMSSMGGQSMAQGFNGGMMGGMGQGARRQDEDLHVLVGDDDGMDIDALLTNMEGAGGGNGGFVSVQ